MKKLESKAEHFAHDLKAQKVLHGDLLAQGQLSVDICPRPWGSVVILISVPSHYILSHAPEFTHPISLLSAFTSSHEIIEET